MARASIPDARPRRSFALVLLATTTLAAVLGGCGQTSSLFSREPKLAAADQIGAVTQWATAYAKKPDDPKMALGYAQALKAIGSRDRALEVLTAGYRANPANGEVAAELGRLALDMDRLEIAGQTLKVAEAQGVHDWKTLSAQGTLRAKQGKHAEAQQYFLAALQEQPDAVSVINNLALSYALDGKPDKSEELLRKTVDAGHGDRRVRQNLALVLGLQGKFAEARQVASVDMNETDAKESMAYLQNMVSNSTQFAAVKPGTTSGDDWTPFAANNADDAAAAANKTAAAEPIPASPTKMQVLKAEETVEAPAAPAAGPATQTSTPVKAAKLAKVAGTPALIKPVNAEPTQASSTASPAALLRIEND